MLKDRSMTLKYLVSLKEWKWVDWDLSWRSDSPSGDYWLGINGRAESYTSQKRSELEEAEIQVLSDQVTPCIQHLQYKHFEFVYIWLLQQILYHQSTFDVQSIDLAPELKYYLIIINSSQ